MLSHVDKQITVTQTGNTPRIFFHCESMQVCVLLISRCDSAEWCIISVREEKDSFDCLLMVGYSDGKKQHVRVCVFVCAYMYLRMMGPCTGYATLASHHSSLP